MFEISEKIKKQGTAVGLGYFDGIHRGHQAVLGAALKKAKEHKLVPVVMLFDIHPRKLISGKVPPMLTSEERKKEILEGMGFTVVDFNFREAMNYAPEEFIEKILVERLGAKFVSCGYDYHYGKGGKGNAETLHKELAARGIESLSLSPILLGNEVISSTRIRQLIMDGEIEKANTMLGKEFTYDFVVKKGDGLGHGLGFPTINQYFPQDFIVPRYGVYLSRARVGNKYYTSVTNVGIRPTVNKDSMRSETCILDFSGDLYGQKIEVSLLRYIRGEIKFGSLDELKAQIAKDINIARLMYNDISKNSQI